MSEEYFGSDDAVDAPWLVKTWLGIDASSSSLRFSQPSDLVIADSAPGADWAGIYSLVSGAGLTRVWKNDNGYVLERNGDGAWTLKGASLDLLSEAGLDNPWSALAWTQAGVAYNSLQITAPSDEWSKRDAEQNENTLQVSGAGYAQANGDYLIDDASATDTGRVWRKVLSNEEFILQAKSFAGTPQTWRWQLFHKNSIRETLVYQTAAQAELGEPWELVWQAALPAYGAAPKVKPEQLIDTVRSASFLRRNLLDASGKLVNNYELSFDNEGYLTLSADSLQGKVSVKSTGPALQNEQWYLVALRIDAGGSVNRQLRLSVARCEVDRDNLPVWMLSTSQVPFRGDIAQNRRGKLILGAVPGQGWTSSLQLDVDNLNIWQRVIADEFIRQLAGGESETLGFEKGLVSQYLFDDGGLTVEDFCQPEDWFGLYHSSQNENRLIVSGAGLENVNGVYNKVNADATGIERQWRKGALYLYSVSTVANEITSSAWVIADNLAVTTANSALYYTAASSSLGDPWRVSWQAGKAEDAPAPGFAMDISCHDSEWRAANALRSWQHAGVVYPLDSGNAVLYGMVPDSALNEDSDRDGLPDWWEIKYFGNLSQGPYDDYDGDGLSNLEEYQLSLVYGGSYENGLDPTNPDTDGDGMPDGWEHRHGFNPLDPSDGDEDADGDGLSNALEYYIGTDPRNPDTDGDGMDDGWEYKYMTSDPVKTLNPLDPSDRHKNPDGDAWDNITEYHNRTNPLVYNPSGVDTDGDGLNDEDEFAFTLTDIFYQDTDDDEFNDYEEYSAGSSGHDSRSKPGYAGNQPGFDYQGNRSLQIMAKDSSFAADCIQRGVLTVPEANDPDRLAFGSWTIEARMRVRDLLDDDIQVGKRVFLLRRAFAEDSRIEGNEALDAAAPSNYAIGYKLVKGISGRLAIEPFASFMVPGAASLSIVTAPLPIELSLEDETSDLPLLKSDWLFVSASYHAGNQKLTLYLDGEFKAERGVGGSSANVQCPTSVSGHTAYVKLGEHMVSNDLDLSGDIQARMLIDEVRVWGVHNSTVRVRGGGFINSFTRSAEEIAFGVTRSVYPRSGVYDPSLNIRYLTTAENGAVLQGNPQSYVVDIRIDDNEVEIPLGIVGQSAGTLAYSDLNGNGKWDVGEYVWLDRNYKIVVDNEGNETREYSTSVKTYFYDEDYDVPLSPSTGWDMGSINRTVVGEDGASTTVTIDPKEGRALHRAYYYDRDNSESVSADDFIWIEYDHEADNWYLPKYKRWAEAQGLALYLMFDDGGGSIEDYAWHADGARRSLGGAMPAVRFCLPATASGRRKRKRLAVKPTMATTGLSPTLTRWAMPGWSIARRRPVIRKCLSIPWPSVKLA